MAYLDTYRSMLESRGATARERNINIIKRDIHELAPANPAYKRISYAGKETYVVINSQDDYKIKEFVTMPGERIPFGSIVIFSDMPWLVTDIDVDDEIYSKGKMYLCNCVLKWRAKDGTIYSYDGWAEDATKYSEGVESTQYIGIGEFQLKVKVQVDEISNTIWRDMRFIIDADKYIDALEPAGLRPYVFRVTRRNIVTGTYESEGYVEITLVEDQWIEGRDDAEEMIAAQPYEMKEPYPEKWPEKFEQPEEPEEPEDPDNPDNPDEPVDPEEDNGGWL